MKNFFQYSLMFLGVLFLLELVALGWFYVVDPLGLFATIQEKGDVLIQPIDASAVVSTDTLNSLQVSEDGQQPSVAQTEAAASMGVSIPTFTQEQISCFESILGAARVAEIKNGAVPTPLEFYKAQSCL